MKLTINVTAQDIEEGVQCNCFQCPIAKAMLRQIPGCEHAEARQAVLYFRTADNRRGKRATPPDEARQFMEDFDTGRTVSPFSFTAKFTNGEVDRDGKERMHAI